MNPAELFTFAVFITVPLKGGDDVADLTVTAQLEVATAADTWFRLTAEVSTALIKAVIKRTPVTFDAGSRLASVLDATGVVDYSRSRVERWAVGARMTHVTTGDTSIAELWRADVGTVNASAPELDFAGVLSNVETLRDLARSHVAVHKQGKPKSRRDMD